MLRCRLRPTLMMFASGQPFYHNHLPTERNLQTCVLYILTRAAALAEWRGLLSAGEPSGVGNRRLVHSSDTTLRSGTNGCNFTPTQMSRCILERSLLFLPWNRLFPHPMFVRCVENLSTEA